MITLISGTNRINSYSRQVCEYYKSILENLGQTTAVLDLTDLPKDFLHTALYENVGKSDNFNQFHSVIHISDKFVFVVPEYNGSFPGILKTFIDAMDYPSGFKNKKGALIGLSSGAMAGALALSHLTDILNYLGMHVLAIKPRISKIGSIMKDGQITDKKIEEMLYQQANALIEF